MPAQTQSAVPQLQTRVVHILAARSEMEDKRQYHDEENLFTKVRFPLYPTNRMTQACVQTCRGSLRS